MQIIKLLISEKLTNAEFALKQASSENIIAVCQNYLHLLNEYRDELYKVREMPLIDNYQSSYLARELAEQMRNSIRSALELATSERNKTESLLKSFTNIGGYEAVQTFNQLEYKGFSDWELRANEVRLKNDDNDEKFTIQEAVELASLLRRKAFIIYKRTFFGDLSE